MSLSPDLGPSSEVQLSRGTVRYRECGEGPPLVFVHGLLVNGDLWRKVVPLLADRFRCITPDLPLGAHEIPMAGDADLSISGVAELLIEFIQALDLDQPTVVANNTGGAITQVAMTEYSEAVGRVVLTSCDCFENFLPAMFRPLQKLAHIPALLTALIQPLRFSAVRRTPVAFGWLAKTQIDSEIQEGYVRSLFGNARVRGDCFKVLRDINPSYTLRAAEKLSNYHAPVLVAWAADDRFFPLEHGRRIASIVPQGQFVAIEDSYTFVSEDQPLTLAKEIADFLGDP